MPEVGEWVINAKLADILKKDFGLDCRAERISGRRRPDIRCYYKGFIIGIEASYDKSDAERDAESRIEQGLVDISLALWIKERFKDVPEDQLYEDVKMSKYSVKVFTHRELSETLLQFLEKGIERRAEQATGWFEDIDLPLVKEIVENSISFLIKEEEIQSFMSSIKLTFEDFIKVLKDLDSKNKISEKLYNILYKLYGLSVAETRDSDVVFGHVALSILLSTVFYEHIRNEHPQLQSVTSYVEQYGPIEGLRRALKDLLKIGYKAAVELTIEILDALPQSAGQRVESLISLGVKIASRAGLLRRDFAGRLYHEITGDIALKKGFATFYTEVPAAYLLATLAVFTLLDLDDTDLFSLDPDRAREIADRIRSIKLGDLACGSGTLLTASYNALVRAITALKFYYGLDSVDLSSVSKKLIEEGIYGIDALRYASQITAINLALIGPGIIERENVYTIYLGYIPGKNQAWLGSLELLNNAHRVGGLLAYIEGGLKGIAERVTLEGSGGVFSIPKSFDLVIMNPPFTRPTYRGRRKFAEEEKRGFFGFIADEEARELLNERYKEILEKVSNDLKNIAQEAVEKEIRDIPDEIKEIIAEKADEKLRQYLNIGLAGEALSFLYLAYKYVDKDGVIAFVLPRAVLAGVSWFLTRVLLASKFHLKYVIVSSDPKNGYNFSEGASLSEVLLVAKRTDSHDPSEETMFVILTKKPKTALEGVLVTNGIIEARRSRMSSFSHGDVEFEVRIVKREDLLKHIDNWNRFVAISERGLSDYMFRLITEGLIVIGGKQIIIPITKLGNILKTVYIERKQAGGRKIIKISTKSIGIDAHQFYDLYIETSKSPYPALIGTEEESRKYMKIEPNAYITPKSDSISEKAIKTFRTYAGRILVPGVNIWWDTSHVIAMYSDNEMLSNTHYAIKLEVSPSVERSAEKALTLWFNTTWGLLTILINREETRGRWAQIKMGQWMLMPVLNVASLNNDTLKKLEEVFDKYAKKLLRRIPEQFNPNNPDPVRLGIDRDFIKTFNPSLEDRIIEEELMKLYNHIDIALKRWIGNNN